MIPVDAMPRASRSVIRESPPLFPTHPTALQSPESLSFPQLLMQYRERIGLTRLELAQRAYFSSDYIARLERGARRPSPSTVELLAFAMRLKKRDRLCLLASAARCQNGQ